jgi:outer membrane immunogenic protein
MGIPTKAPVLAPAAMTWTGFYVGAQAGVGWATTNWTNTIGITTNKFDGSGVVGGVTAGYNWQAPGSRFVFGIEADISASGVDPTKTTLACGVSCESNLKAFGTIRGRVGYSAFDNTLLYVTGGAAVGRFDYRLTGFTEDQTHWGWTLGAGVEYALTHHWSMKIEYLYTKFENGSLNVPPFPVITVPFDMNLVRIGVNYRW